MMGKNQLIWSRISRARIVLLCATIIAAGIVLLIDGARMLLPTHFSKITDEKADKHREFVSRMGRSKIPELLPLLPVVNTSNRSISMSTMEAPCSSCAIASENEINHLVIGEAKSNLPNTVEYNKSEENRTVISFPNAHASPAPTLSAIGMHSMNLKADVHQEISSFNGPSKVPELLPLLPVTNLTNKSLPESTTEISCGSCAILDKNPINHAIKGGAHSNQSNNSVANNGSEKANATDTATASEPIATKVHTMKASRLSKSKPFHSVQSTMTPRNVSSMISWSKSRQDFLSDIVVLMTTGSYLQNCSALPSSVPCPPDRADLVELATNPKRGWLRGIKHIVVSNHAWPPLGVRGIDEVSIAPRTPGYDRNSSETLVERRRRLVGQAGLLKDKFRNEIIIHGVLLANDTFGEEGFKWIVGGDDDTIFMFSKLVPFLRLMDSSKPLFIGVPGPGNIGRWYCADQWSASRARRGPVCCSNFSEPCPVFGLDLPTRWTNASTRGKSLEFFREDEIAQNTTAAIKTKSVPFNHCCGTNAATAASSLVLKAMQCTKESCCGIEHGTRKNPKKVGVKERTAAAMAAHLHWPAGHFAYGGGGWLISNGLIERNGNDERTIWEMCSTAISSCPTVAADVALSTCIFNIGFTLGVAPPYIFPGTSAEKKSVLARVDEYPTSSQGFATQTPGTFVTASLHHINLQSATHATSLDEVILRGYLDTNDEGSSERALRKIFWAGVQSQCKCQPGQNPQEMAIRGTGCVPSNCGKKQKIVPGKGKGACCRCTENQWRAVFSPRCSWFGP